MPSPLIAETPMTPDQRPSWVLFSSRALLPAELMIMTPLLIALVTAHFSSSDVSGTAVDTVMICAPSSTAWLMSFPMESRA